MGTLSALPVLLWTLAQTPAPADPGGTVDDAPGEPTVRPGTPAADLLRARALAFSRFRSPVRGPARVVGGTSNGCILGAQQLPASGPGFEVLHLERHRRHGHPDMVAFIKRLGLAAKKKKIAPLLVGDLSQARGGPTPTGHRSHQSGLDADIGFTHPAWVGKKKLTRKQREDLFPPPVIDLRTKTFTSAFTPATLKLVELAARDQAVDRIFVHPMVKERLCAASLSNETNRYWLRVVRPWWGHHDHLHVRLRCPQESPDCVSQAPLPPGDGCKELTWWLSGEAEKSKAPKPAPATPVEPAPPPPLPAACQALIDSSRS